MDRRFSGQQANNHHDISIHSTLNLLSTYPPRAVWFDFNRSPPPGTAASPIVTISPYPVILSSTISDTYSSSLGPKPTKSSGRCHRIVGSMTGASGKSRCFEYSLRQSTDQLQWSNVESQPRTHTTVSILNPSIPRSSQKRTASS